MVKQIQSLDGEMLSQESGNELMESIIELKKEFTESVAIFQMNLAQAFQNVNTDNLGSDDVCDLSKNLSILSAA